MKKYRTPENPKVTWREILVAIDDSQWRGAITSRRVSELFGISIYDASYRIRMLNAWFYIKMVSREAHGIKVYKITMAGTRKAQEIREKGEA